LKGNKMKKAEESKQKLREGIRTFLLNLPTEIQHEVWKKMGGRDKFFWNNLYLDKDCPNVSEEGIIRALDALSDIIRDIYFNRLGKIEELNKWAEEEKKNETSTRNNRG
jgi:hypothetical protein